MKDRVQRYVSKKPCVASKCSTHVVVHARWLSFFSAVCCLSFSYDMKLLDISSSCFDEPPPGVELKQYICSSDEAAVIHAIPNDDPWSHLSPGR